MFTFESGCLPGWEVTLKEQDCTFKKKKTTKAHSLLLLNIFLQNMHRITSLKELNGRMTFSWFFFINYADLMIFLDSTFTYFLLRH